MAALASARPAENLKRPFVASLVFHAVLGTLLFVAYLNPHSGESWGGPGGATQVGIVGSVPAIPMPRPQVVTENRVVDESKGLYKAEPQAPPKMPFDATPLPKFEKTKPPKPKAPSHPSKLLENPAPPPQNAIPYGQGGTPNVPYSSPQTFKMGSATQGGLGFNGVNGANFGSRYSWYVEAVQRRVSMNWLQSTIDPSVQFAPRCVIDFQILRNGTITNIQIQQSSGNQSVDTSAVRAVSGSNPVQPLPNDYSGSYVNVEFWFDFRRQ